MNLKCGWDAIMTGDVRAALGAETMHLIAEGLRSVWAARPDLLDEVEAAYAALKAGDDVPAERLFTRDFGLDPHTAHAILERLPDLLSRPRH